MCSAIRGKSDFRFCPECLVGFCCEQKLVPFSSASPIRNLRKETDLGLKISKANYSGQRRFTLPPTSVLLGEGPTIPQYQTCKKFSLQAKKLYLANLMKASVVLKYRHSIGIKVTDGLVCLVYRPDKVQDVKKIEKFHGQLMQLLVAKKSYSVTMETDHLDLK
ncbi:signal recognition particle 9 kDa protein-like [Phyllostomus hastatus]|uniref:signal recognition particle 9 kDa protein-like n=1 Tax=Phyllostomus hastatus TaxID=9423 RepID=UPI001E680118|nr:signal recognition particle 9 kDa protein-like [Phyllostomus hastatus]